MSKTFTQFREEILPENVDLFSVLSNQSLVDVLLDETNEDVVSLLALQELFERGFVELDIEDYDTLDESLQYLSEEGKVMSLIKGAGRMAAPYIDRGIGYAAKKGGDLLNRARSALKPPKSASTISPGKEVMVRPGTSVAKPSGTGGVSKGKEVALRPSTAVSKSVKTPTAVTPKAPKAGGPSRLAKGATIAGATLLGGSAMKGGTGAKPGSSSRGGSNPSSGPVSGGSGSKSAGGGKTGGGVRHSTPVHHKSAQTPVKKSLPSRRPEADPNAPGGPGGRVTAVAYGSRKAGVTSTKNVYQNAKGKPTELAPKPRRDTATGGKWM